MLRNVEIPTSCNVIRYPCFSSWDIEVKAQDYKVICWTDHFSGQLGVLLACHQQVHCPAHGRGSQQGHHLFLSLTIKVHSANLHTHTHKDTQTHTHTWSLSSQTLTRENLWPPHKPLCRWLSEPVGVGIKHWIFPPKVSGSWFSCQSDWSIIKILFHLTNFPLQFKAVL